MHEILRQGPLSQQPSVTAATVGLIVTGYNWSSQLGSHATASNPTNKEAAKPKPPDPPPKSVDFT